MDKRINEGLTNLSDTQLDAIAGGLIVDMGEGWADGDRFILVDDTNGKFRMSSDSLESCIVHANGGHAGRGRTYSTDVITPDQYEERFGTKI